MSRSPGCYERQVESDLLVFVEVVDAALSNAAGSKVLVNGSGSSWRKYSSGVLNSIPTFAAKFLPFCKSLMLLSMYQGYLSEHAWSALAPFLAARPPASPTKNEACISGPLPPLRSNSSSTSSHIPVRGFLYPSCAQAAKRSTGKSK